MAASKTNLETIVVDAAPPLRFGLRSLFALTAAVAIVVASGRAFGALGFFLATIFVVCAAVVWNSPTPRRAAARFIVLALVVAGLYLLRPRYGSRVPALRTQCQRNMRQLGYALENHEAMTRTFPAVHTLDANGQPLHSWRTALLPYLEEQALAKQIDMNQPWNSPRNFNLCNTPLKVFQCFADKRIQPAGSSYVAVIAPGSVWEPGKARRIGSISDAPSDTLLLVEWHDSGIQWAEPRDLDLTNMPQWLRPWIPRLLARHYGQFVGVFVDGHVEFIPGTIPEDQWMAIITRNGGEKVDRGTWGGRMH